MNPGRIQFKKADNGYEARYQNGGATHYFIKLTGRMNPTPWMLVHTEIDDLTHRNLDYWFDEAINFPRSSVQYWDEF